jgi:hypothetical protein
MLGLSKSLSFVVSEMKELERLSVNPKVNFAMTSVPSTVGTATAAAKATTSAATPTGGGGNTNIVPVAIYLDSKKIGELLDPRYKQMIQDSLRNIGGKTVPV